MQHKNNNLNLDDQTGRQELGFNSRFTDVITLVLVVDSCRGKTGCVNESIIGNINNSIDALFVFVVVVFVLKTTKKSHAYHSIDMRASRIGNLSSVVFFARIK